VFHFYVRRFLFTLNFNCFQVEEIWNPPGDNCTTYRCEKHDDQFIPVISLKSCPPFNHECDPVSTPLPVLIFEKVAVASISERGILVFNSRSITQDVALILTFLNLVPIKFHFRKANQN